VTRAGSPVLDVVEAIPPDVDLVVVRSGARWLIGMYPEVVVTERGPESFATLEGFERGWWAGFLTYDLGRVVEPFACRLPDELRLPDLALGRFDARLVVDGRRLMIEGGGPARRDLERVAQRARQGSGRPVPCLDLGPWSSSLPRPTYEDGVRAVRDLIEAGECYQVNLTRRLRCHQRADPVAVFSALLRANPAPHAALIRLGDVTVVSASPEQFLRRRGSEVETRPIKGTARHAEGLAGSCKDRAENVMIVDLARNDLGRVCRYGSVRVAALCAVERHPGLHHLVSTVTGTLRPGVGTGDLLRATFPPASITGAPKPRVMQIIEDLEACRRGVYCGAVGWFDFDRTMLDLNVAIRTFVMTPEGTDLGVGAGIVADSSPAGEWRETELKSARLLAAVGGDSTRRVLTCR
jgi:para-aminobenzoate synthetase component I